MEKSYPHQLAAWVERRKSSKKEMNRVAFLAIREDVQAAIDVGFQLKTIWLNMHESGRIIFGYDAFLQYVKRYNDCGGSRSAAVIAAKASRAVPKETAAAQKPKGTPAKGPAAIPGFTFNSVPRKEDLL